MSAREVREQIDKLMTEYGARRITHGSRRTYVVPITGRSHLKVETHVRGSVTTDLAMERWNCLDAPSEIADPWLEANVWPSTRRWIERTKAWSAFLPTGGSYSGSRVLTAEAVEVLAAWLPKEVEWQHIAASREWAAS
ncbi:hypothetical protein AB4028_00315 [Janibacter sp. RAF20_2_2]|uniref:hypothetical protein n=1 Tax=unclassified Janibacter TaxID=2649294 RepID=UPI003F8ECE4F